MRLLRAAILSLLIVTPAAAGEAEIAAARTVIDSQIKAFLADDGAAAYAHAAPQIRRIFPTVEAFMGMVTNGYPPVRRPRAYSFGAAEEPVPGSVIQRVEILGPDGKNYEAVYTLERQPDGRFQITGCSLRGSNALAI